MKQFGKKLPLRLLSLILILGLVLCCFAACGKDKDDDDGDEETSKTDTNKTDNDKNDDDKTDTDKPEDDKPEVAKPKLNEYVFNGLTYYLTEDYSANQGDAEVAMHTSDTVEMVISGGPMEEVGSGITTAKDMAELFGQMTDGANYEVKTKNGVPYLVMAEQGVAVIAGFYVQGDYGWVMMANCKASADMDAVIDCVTSAKIDPNAVPEVKPVETPVEKDTFTLHAYVPESWGLPGAWAWSNTTGKNVFSAWPGEAMAFNGDHYVIEIPKWAEYIIVNGDNGAIQTQDEPVQPGCDVWVVVAQDSSYNVYFEEPSAQILSAFGY